MSSIYVDYAATTPMDLRVLDAMTPYFAGVYGNASSINTFGLEARDAIDTAREYLASFMNADTNEVIFTGSATEANNFVLKGFAFANGKRHTHIAVSTIEHDCVLNSAKWLESQGYRITYVPVDQMGLVQLDALECALALRCVYQKLDAAVEGVQWEQEAAAYGRLWNASYQGAS